MNKNLHDICMEALPDAIRLIIACCADKVTFKRTDEIYSDNMETIETTIEFSQTGDDACRIMDIIYDVSEMLSSIHRDCVALARELNRDAYEIISSYNKYNFKITLIFKDMTTTESEI